jgi:hypothetical protein
VHTSLNFIVVLLPVFVIYLVVFLYRRLQFKYPDKPANTTIQDFDTSVIMTMYSLAVKLETVSKGILDNKPYTLLITTPLEINLDSLAIGAELNRGRRFSSNLPAEAFHSPSGKIIMRMDLPAVSQVHFAGFSLEDENVRTLLSKTGIDSFMTKVDLEGDFPDYFKLYCSKDHEIELMELLDPTRMVFLVDFCKNLNWELFESALYFSESNTTTSNTNSDSIVQAAEEFAQKILPTLQNMSHSSPPASNIA